MHANRAKPPRCSLKVDSRVLHAHSRESIDRTLCVAVATFKSAPLSTHTHTHNFCKVSTHSRAQALTTESHPTCLLAANTLGRRDCHAFALNKALRITAGWGCQRAVNHSVRAIALRSARSRSIPQDRHLLLARVDGHQATALSGVRTGTPAAVSARSHIQTRSQTPKALPHAHRAC